ncbi:MAG: hypothetical protein Q8L48_19805 [Archangium sp.]|nr:hypothetical protein [Archangium sp.]
MSDAADSLLVALALMLAATASVGLGSLLIALLERAAPVSLSTRFWLGLVAALAILEPLHLVLPMANVARATLALAAGAGLVLQRGQLLTLLRALRWFEAAGLAAGLCAVSLFALGPGPEGDASLYHYPAVRWAASYPVVPGVGNLNPFLGYSHGNFLLLAVLDAGPFAHRSHHLLNPLLVLVTGARCAREALGLFAPRVSSAAVMATAALAVVLGGVASQWFVSPSASVGEPMIVIIVVLETLALMQARADARAWVVALLAVGAVVLKLSAAAVAATAFLFALWSIRRWSPRARLGAAITALVAGVGWLWGGAVRTGYLLYPTVALALPVDWRMDPAVPTSVIRYIAAYTRHTLHRLMPGQDDGAWLGPWLERAALDNELLVPTLLWLLCVGVALRWRQTRGRLWWLTPTALGLVAWVVISPDPQYLGAVLVLHTGLALGLLLDQARPAVAAPLAIALLITLWGVSPSGLPRVKPGGLVPAPSPVTRVHQVSGGPMREPSDLYCADGPLPCASLIEPGLRYRVAGDVAAGFAVRTPDGALPPGFRARWVIDRDFLIGAPR